jgi:hypothetical protein
VCLAHARLGDVVIENIITGAIVLRFGCSHLLNLVKFFVVFLFELEFGVVHVVLGSGEFRYLFSLVVPCQRMLISVTYSHCSLSGKHITLVWRPFKKKD